MKPLPVWKWLIAIAMLLTVPVIILVQQATESFRSTAEMAKNEVGQEVEALSSRIALEMSVKLQLREVLNEFSRPYFAISEQLYYIRNFRRLSKTPLPPEAALGMLALETGMQSRLMLIEARLRSLIPGIRLLKWDSEYRFTTDSDEMLPRWAYQKLLEALHQRLIRRTAKESDRSYLDNVPMLARNFLDANQITMFIKTNAEIYEFSDAAGRRLALYWDNKKVSDFWHYYEAGAGFIAVVDLEKLPKIFAFDMLKLRKAHEWEQTGIEPAWIVEPKPGFYLLPYPFSPLEYDYWAKWLNNRPNGIHEHRGIIASVRRVDGGITLVTAKSGAMIDRQYQRSVFWLILLMFLSLILPVSIVSGFRRNQGMALSIRWQIIALFVLVMALPSAVIFHLGSELLKERRQTYENDAYKVLERIKKNLEENTDYAFRHMENLSSELARRLMALKFDAKGRLTDKALADKIVAEYQEKTGLTAVYMLDSSAEMTFSIMGRGGAGRDMIPLVQALAKIKLRNTGNLRLDGRGSEVGMMDLFIEASGGISVDAVQSILKHRENKAFEFKFSDRRVCFFVGEFSLPGGGDPFIVVVLLKDDDFERMFMRLMIENHATEKKYQNRVQLFFGTNDIGGDADYFRPAQIPEPWFDYSMPGKDTSKLGRLSEPTRFAGVSVRETVQLEKTGRKCLYYSFRPSNLDMHTVLALYDYSEISKALIQLRVFIMVTFLVSLLVGYILAKIMARSLIEPVALLRTGVEQIEKGNYNTHLIMPGQDELVELAESFNVMSHGLDERARMTRYLSKSAVEAVVSGEDGYMGGKKVPATILFSDIRGFTTISESNSPEVVVRLLNDYFAVMNEVVEEHGGDIDKFIGDAIMAQFIAVDCNLETSMNQAFNAVKCALAMMRSLDEFNAARAQRGLFPVKIGVGINSGEVIAGNIGSPGRMDRTVIGDTVNVASRLEGMSKLGRHTFVIISRSTLDLLKDRIEVERLAETSVKGKTTVVEMFEVIALKSYN